MSTYSGNGGTVKVATNTIAEILSFSIDSSAATIDDTALSDTASSFKAGKTSWTASIECHFDPTDTNGQNSMVVGNSMSFVFYQRGETTGDPTITGTAIITSTSSSNASDSIISQTYSLQGTGALAYGVIV